VTEFAIDAFGFDTKQNKARAWIDATLPAFATDDADRRRDLHSTARSFVDATSIAALELLDRVKAALFQNPKSASGDFSQVRLDLWASTEPDFYEAMRVVADETLDADAASVRVDDLRRAFAPILERAATDVFDRWCPGAGLDVTALRRRVAARYQLTSALRGYSKLGESIFAALGIAPPGGGRAARAAKPRKSEENAK
jgi:CRISPR type I-E-associated protein CasA/Cse1